MDANALLLHILSQTRQNVEFLVSQKQISHEVGQDILNKIPSSPVNVEPKSTFPASPGSVSVDDLARRTSILSVSSPTGAGVPATTTVHTSTTHTISTSTPGAYQSPPSAPPYQAPSNEPRFLFKAKALWDYSADPNDLSFRAGQIIGVTEETNADWWRGYVQDDPNKRQGLFPSNYIERIPGSAPPNPSTPASPTYSSSLQSYQSEKPQGYGGYQPYQSPSGPPPPHGGYASFGPPQGPPQGGYYGAPPSGPPGPPANQAPPPAEQPPKKGKFGGKFGGTLAQSAVGGLGFGAGSAVGSGIVNSLF